MINMAGVLLYWGRNISKYHDINFVICIQPKHPHRGDTSPPPALSQIAPAT